MYSLMISIIPAMSALLILGSTLGSLSLLSSCTTTAGIPIIPNWNRGQQPDEPEIGLTPMAGKGQMIPNMGSRQALPNGRTSRLRQKHVTQNTVGGNE